MKFHHLGLNIRSEEERVAFYQNILGFHPEYQFEMPLVLGNKIFGVNKQLKVYKYMREDIILELFVHSVIREKSFAHICLEIKDRESIVARCEESGYQVTRIKRENKADMLFVEDKAGNIFELIMVNNENLS